MAIIQPSKFIDVDLALTKTHYVRQTFRIAITQQEISIAIANNSTVYSVDL